MYSYVPVQWYSTVLDGRQYLDVSCLWTFADAASIFWFVVPLSGTGKGKKRLWRETQVYSTVARKGKARWWEKELNEWSVKKSQRKGRGEKGTSTKENPNQNVMYCRSIKQDMCSICLTFRLADHYLI